MPRAAFACVTCSNCYPTETEALACEVQGVWDPLPLGLVYESPFANGVYCVVRSIGHVDGPHGSTRCVTWNARDVDAGTDDNDDDQGSFGVTVPSLFKVPEHDAPGLLRCLDWARRQGVEPIVFTEAMRSTLGVKRFPARMPSADAGASDAVRSLETTNAYLQRDLDAARDETRQVKELLEQERKRHKDKSSVAGKLISYYRAGLLEAKAIMAADAASELVPIKAGDRRHAFFGAYGVDPAKEPAQSK